MFCCLWKNSQTLRYLVFCDIKNRKASNTHIGQVGATDKLAFFHFFFFTFPGFVSKYLNWLTSKYNKVKGSFNLFFFVDKYSAY